MTLSIKIYTYEQIETLRDIRFRRTPELQIINERQALKFVNDVGFCFVFKSNKSELPCLWHAACGKRAPVMPHHTHHDPYIGFVWNTKDTLPAKKAVYYGKALKKRPTMISLEYFPFFYALSGNNGKLNKYTDQYMRGELSTSARHIMDALLENSPQITRELKIASGHSAPSKRYIFDQAMAELQMKMHVVKIAELYDPFSFVWELAPKRFPEEIKLAKKISQDNAREKILIKYFENLIASNATRIDLLFGWGKDIIKRHLAVLVDKKIISPDVKIEGERGEWFILTEELKL
jgi:hypothetical protein